MQIFMERSRWFFGGSGLGFWLPIWRRDPIFAEGRISSKLIEEASFLVGMGEKKVVGSALEIVKDATSAFWPDIFYDICHSTQSLSWTHTKWVLPGVHLWTSGIWICPASIFRTQEGFWMLLDVGWGYTGPRKRTVCSCFRLGFATPCIWHRDRGVFSLHNGAKWAVCIEYNKQ